MQSQTSYKEQQAVLLHRRTKKDGKEEKEQQAK